MAIAFGNNQSLLNFDDLKPQTIIQKEDFVHDINLNNLNLLQDEWTNNQFLQFPEIEIRSKEELNGGNGAYSHDLEGFLMTND